MFILSIFCFIREAEYHKDKLNNDWYTSWGYFIINEGAFTIAGVSYVILSYSITIYSLAYLINSKGVWANLHDFIRHRYIYSLKANVDYF